MGKNKKLELINTIALVFYVCTYLTVFIFFENDSSVFGIRHIALAIALAVSMISLVAKHGLRFYKKISFGKNGLNVLFIMTLFFLVSLIKALSVGEGFDFRTIIQICLFGLPVLYALNIVNIFRPETLIFVLKIATIIFVFFYFMEPAHTLSHFFNIENWQNINLIKSSTFTESHICAETFLQLFLFFYYCNYALKRRKKTNKSIKIFMVICLVFTILSFKRLGALFAVAILIGGCILNYQRQIKNKYKNIILATVVVICTLIYFGFLEGSIFKELNVDAITTNRGYILSLWRGHGYYSYGYGTSLFVIGRYLEMDLVQILLELGIVCLWAFCFVFFKMAEKKVFTNLVVMYVMLNLMTSSTMPWTTGWVFFGMMLFAISGRYLDDYIFKQSDGYLKKIGDV